MMALTREDLRAYCLGKRGAREDFPFDDEPVYKVGGKIFAFLSKSGTVRMSLKCDPALVPVLRQTYAAVTVAPYLNKQHWNLVILDGTIPEDEILEMIDNSYALVVKGLTKAQREMLFKD